MQTSNLVICKKFCLSHCSQKARIKKFVWMSNFKMFFYVSNEKLYFKYMYCLLYCLLDCRLVYGHNKKIMKCTRRIKTYQENLNKTPVVRPGVHYKISFTGFGRPAKIKMRMYAENCVFSIYVCFQMLAEVDLNFRLNICKLAI